MANPKYQHIGSIDHRLTEECAELIKAICKAERFGYDNFHPERPEGSNSDAILREINDVRRLLDEMEIFLERAVKITGQ